MSAYGSIPPGSVVESPENPPVDSLPVGPSLGRYICPGSRVTRTALAPSGDGDRCLSSALRHYQCDLESEIQPARVSTRLDSRPALPQYGESGNCCSLVPLQPSFDTFARLYIFDWDNTLCPTDWLCQLYARYGLSVYTAKRPCAALLSPVIRSRLAALESSVRRLLQKCRERGQVAILSNATSIGLIKTLRLLPLIQRTVTELSAPNAFILHSIPVCRKLCCCRRLLSVQQFHTKFFVAIGSSALQRSRLYLLGICVSRAVSR